MKHVEKPAKEQERHVWDNPKNVQVLLWALFAVCGLIAVVDFFIARHESFEHGLLSIEGISLFYPFYGFFAYVSLVLVARQLRKVVMRDEDYYGD